MAVTAAVTAAVAGAVTASGRVKAAPHTLPGACLGTELLCHLRHG